MDRQPVVAGQFYNGRENALRSEVQKYLALASEKSGRPTILAMSPHAGYVYSGAVAGRTLGRADLAGTVLLLGPNHTGQGRALAVWPEGRWFTPLGGVAVDSDLADKLLCEEDRLSPDYRAHISEHSLEVMLPFLAVINPEVRIVPVCVSENRYEILASVGAGIARTLKKWSDPVSIVVSSDMSHYISHNQAKARDALALESIIALDPEGLLGVVRKNSISMCGVLPMTLGLVVAKALGAASAEVAAYATSGDASGDFERVVGYAGVIVD
ncbi:MAG: AmmeMemoRadiSam system protein B [Thermodesulfobacteriota bacterium]|nr:AmmeMemoRadiSam system protein B [Thermodesulfobacteriota bacterium]